MKKIYMGVFTVAFCITLIGCMNQMQPSLIQTLKPATRREYIDNFLVTDIETGQRTIMDIYGNIVLDEKYIPVAQFNKYGLVRVGTMIDNNYQSGILDMNGNLVIPFQNVALTIIDDKEVILYSMQENENESENVEYSQGLMDFDGNIILPAAYEQIIYVNEYRIFVKKKGMWEIIDLGGTIYKKLDGVTYLRNEGDGLIAYTTAERDDICPWFAVTGQWGYMDLDGNVVLPEQYDEANTFYEGIAFVRVKDETSHGGGYLQLIDKQGNVIKEFEGGYVTNEGKSLTGFSELFGTRDVEVFQDGIAIVNPGVEGEGYGVMDTDGNWIIEPKYLVWYDDGIITLIRDWEEESEQYEYYDKSGKLLLELEWPCAISKHGHVFYMKEENIYLLDRAGNTILQIPDGYIPDDAYVMWSKWQEEHE